MSDGVKIKILVQVENEEPRVIGEARLNPANVQADLERVFMALVKYVRANPMANPMGR